MWTFAIKCYYTTLYQCVSGQWQIILFLNVFLNIYICICLFYHVTLNVELRDCCCVTIVSRVTDWSMFTSRRKKKVNSSEKLRRKLSVKEETEMGLTGPLTFSAVPRWVMFPCQNLRLNPLMCPTALRLYLKPGYQHNDPYPNTHRDFSLLLLASILRNSKEKRGQCSFFKSSINSTFVFLQM